MANIAIKYVGLTGQKYDLTIDNGQTVTQLRAAIATAEALTLTYYGNVSLLSDISKNYLNNPSDTLATIGAVAGSIFLCTPEQDSIDKQTRQVQKLEIAQEKRQADGDTTKPYYRINNTYDLTLLPDTYNGNVPGVDDNPNTGGLLQGRPWVNYAGIAFAANIWRTDYEGYFNDVPSFFTTAALKAAPNDYNGTDTTISEPSLLNNTSI
jgi:hypothetical protein